MEKSQQPYQAPWNAPKSWVKAVIAGVVLAIGFYAVTSDDGYVVSTNAVVSGYVISLRSPIDGELSHVREKVGDSIGNGEVEAEVFNPRFDKAPLVELKETSDRIKSDLRSARHERDVLVALRSTLEERSDTHARYLHDRLSGVMNDTQRLLDAKITERDQLARDLRRKVVLVQDGWTSREAMEHTKAAYIEACREVGALQSRLDAAKSEADASSHEIITAPGSNDVSYSAQRADEIAIKIADQEKFIDQLSTQSESIDARLAYETQHANLMEHASIRSPIDGMIWKIAASNGERIAAGDQSAEIVDCHSAFVIAAIDQDEFPNIENGGVAKFRLSGEHSDRQGVVLSVTADKDVSGDRNLAAAPVTLSKHALSLVRVSVPPSDNHGGSCFVGRTARVLLPASGGGIQARATRLVKSIF